MPMNGARGEAERLRVHRVRCPWFKDENRGRSVTSTWRNAHLDEPEKRAARTREARTFARALQVLSILPL